MTADRSEAYGRVMRTLADMGPSKLQRREQDVVRDAADALLFADDAESDASAEAAMADFYDLAARLVGADRWLPETAERLVRDVEAAGPSGFDAEVLEAELAAA